MKIHRFIGDFDISNERIRIVDADFVNQVRNVLKLKPGETVLLCDGIMNEVEAEITACGRDSVELIVLKRLKNEAESERRITLYMAMLKKDNFEVAIQKAVECGVSEIIPFISGRTVKTGINIGRMEKIIREAAEQSGRGILPELLGEMSFKEAADQVGSRKGENIIFDPMGEDIRDIIKNGEMKGRDINVFIGPEGGFTDEELQIAKAAGFRVVSIGKTILRAETAAAIGVYLAANLMTE